MLPNRRQRRRQRQQEHRPLKVIYRLADGTPLPPGEYSARTSAIIEKRGTLYVTVELLKKEKQ